MHVPAADGESRKLKQNWSNKNPTRTLVIYSSCRKCQVILNDQEQLELLICFIRKVPLVLSAEPLFLPWEYFLFSQTHEDPRVRQLNALLCLMLSERKVVSLMTKPLLLVLLCLPNTYCTQIPRFAEKRCKYEFFDISKPRLEEQSWTAPAELSNSLDFPGVT